MLAICWIKGCGSFERVRHECPTLLDPMLASVHALGKLGICNRCLEWYRTCCGTISFPILSSLVCKNMVAAVSFGVQLEGRRARGGKLVEFCL